MPHLNFRVLAASFLFAVVLVGGAGAAQASVTFYVTFGSGTSGNPDKSPWLDNVATPFVFLTESANIALADEVLTPPGNNTVGLGGAAAELTFPAGATGLPWSFTLSAPGSLVPLDGTTGFTYNDIDGTSPSIWRTGVLSPGDIDNHEDDDVFLSITSGPPLLGIGFDIINTGAVLGEETIRVYGAGDVLLDTLEVPEHGLGANINVFIGIISTVPIERIEFDEDPGPDDVGVRDFRFVTEIGVNPYADQVASYTPVIKSGEPTAENRVAENAIGAPDFGAGAVPHVSLGDGGEIVLEFTDNSMTGSGDSAADLRIFEVGGDVEDTFVDVSEDGVAWLSVGTVSGSTSVVDLDAFGIGPEDDLFFVRLTDDPDKDNQTGPSVGADIDSVEALTTKFYAEDTDFDGVPDIFDNCPDFYNPSQEDDDGDGVGDFCDNCKSSYNPNQENTGGAPERGDACGTVTLELVRDSMAINPTFGLRLDCSLVGVPVSEVNVGLRIPFGAVPATADFGGGCDAPINPIAPGVPTGLGCTANVYLGSNVSAADSGAYGPGLASPFASDAKYIHVRGNGADDRLCDPYSGSYLLGRFTTGPSPLFSPTSVIVSPGLSNVGLKKAADIDGEPIEFGFAVIAGAADPDLKIILKPAAGEDEATATRWSLCISDITDQRMHRISAGLRVVDATDADIRVLGCDSTPDMSGVRDCDADMPDISVGPTVDDANSFTMGPFESPTAPTVPDTMYVVVEGSAAAPGATTLNPTQFQEWCVATIEVDAPPGTAGVPPEFVTNGLALLPYSDMTTDAWQTSSTLLDPLTLEQVALDNGFNQGDDLDGDGELDTADNCDFAENPGQENNGDFLLIPSPPDDDGDACECGDANGSGAVFDSGTPDLDPEDPMGPPLTPDLDLIRAYLVGNNTDPAVAAVCSVSEGIDCNTKDAVVLQRAFNAQGPGVEVRCDAALPD